MDEICYTRRERCIQRQTDRKTDRQTDRQTEKLTNRYAKRKKKNSRPGERAKASYKKHRLIRVIMKQIKTMVT